MGVWQEGQQYVIGVGVAGTADPNVVTVQGIAGGTPIPVTATLTQVLDNGDAIALTTTPRNANYILNGTPTWDRVRSANSDGQAATGLTAAANMGWNGATWDRLKSTLANGLVVDVSRVQGTVAVTQSTSPWVVSLTSTTITGTVAVTQSTSPWVVSLTSTTITGTVAVTQSTSPWVVSLTSTTITGTVAVTQSTSPWVVSLTSTTITGTVAVTQVLDNGDAIALASTPRNANYVLNGTPTWDRVRAANSDAQAATGLTAAGLMGFNGATWDRVRVANTGRLQVDVITGGGSGAAQAPGDAITPVATPAATTNFLEGFNGATWDRLRSTTANGLAVDVTRVQGTVAVTQSTSPWVANITQWGSSAVDAAAARLPSTLAVATGAGPDVNATNYVGNATNSWDPFLEPTGDGLTVAGRLSAGLIGWNGATWDRLKSTTANGLDVDVTRIQGNVTVISSQTTPADALANTAGLPTINQLEIWNGATWDRWKEITTADAATVTGIAAVVSRIFNGATYDNPREITTADAVGVAGLQAHTLRVFNGTTYDNWYSIKASATTAGTNVGIPKVGQARLTTYGINARLTTRSYFLSHAFAGPGRFQYLTIFHGAGSTKTVRIKQVTVQFGGLITAAALVTFDLSRLTAATTPATGNPALTPQSANAGAAAAEATVLALPTTQGIEASATNVFSSYQGSYGITGAAPTTNPPPPVGRFDLWQSGINSHEIDDPVMRAGTAEGWAVILDVNIACTATAVVQVTFTEE